MHGNRRPRARRYPSGNHRGIHVEGLGIHVHEHRFCSAIQDDVCGRNPSEGGYEYFIAVDETLPAPAMAPEVGEHSQQVLRDVLGYDDDKIAALERSGALG